jgi:histidinol phosphatase-like PHP family hydrolase
VGADPLINLHTHSKYSDGDFTVEQLAAAAEQSGVTHLAITDHFETSKVRCLRVAQVDEYLGEIMEARRRHPTVQVLAGVEIDTVPARCAVEAMPLHLLNRLDIVLFEYVDDTGSTLEALEPLLSRLRPPHGLAHMDIERIYAGQRPEAVAERFRRFGMFVEVNSAWPYRREGVPFYELAAPHYEAFRGRVKVSVGTDVHRSLGEVGNLERPYRFLRRLGLEGELVLEK